MSKPGGRLAMAKAARSATTVLTDTTPLATSPGLTLRLAVLNSSLALVEYRVYLFYLPHQYH